MKTKTRYAPSPTGRLHIGGIRTALFCYLFAKHNKGDFIVRIEDTDIERNVDGGIENQLDGLEWLGITPDISPRNPDNLGPYKQTERIEIYNKYIDVLLKEGIAYRCYCTEKELDEERQHQINNGNPSPKYSKKCRDLENEQEGSYVVRIKLPKDKDFCWEDGVRGKICINSKDVGDWVIRKSNGIPTYNFAVVVDDHLMEITDIFRGEEHISNTAKQIHLYNSFNWDIPKFSHLTLIIGESGKKLSKRDETKLQFIDEYIKKGYLKEAVLNFLSLLGWSPKAEEEIFSKQELIDIFTLEGLSKSPSFFDVTKLKWINNKYIQLLNKKELWELLKTFIDVEYFKKEKWLEILQLFQPQLHEGVEIKDLVSIFIDNQISLSEEQKTSVHPNNDVIKELFDQIGNIKEWAYSNIEKSLHAVKEKTNKKGKNLLMPIRLVLTGENRGPDLKSIIFIFGKEKVLERLNNYEKNN